LTGLGGIRNNKHQVASGIAIIEERKQLHRLAKAKARLMEITEETIFTYAARFMGMRWAGEVIYNTDYEAYDTNYRMALIKEAKALAGGDPVINALINKQIISVLAPITQLQEYEQAYIDTIEDPALKALMTQTNEEVFSRDLEDSMIPLPPVGEENNEYESEDGGFGDDGNSSLLGGVGTPVQDMGTTYYPNQAVAVQLTGLNTGR
jgi:hypothetical protein